MKALGHGILLSGFLALQYPVVAIADLGFDVNYFGMSISTTDSSGNANTTDAKAYLVNPYLHVTHSIGSLVTIGIGPMLGIGSLTPKSQDPNTTYLNGTLIRYSADAIVIADVVPIVKPFVRASFGGEYIEAWQDMNFSGNVIQATLGGKGWQYSVQGGIQFPVSAYLSFYAQAGYSGSGKRTLSVKSATLNGAATTINSDVQLSYTGFLIGGGIILRF